MSRGLQALTTLLAGFKQNLREHGFEGRADPITIIVLESPPIDPFTATHVWSRALNPSMESVQDVCRMHFLSTDDNPQLVPFAIRSDDANVFPYAAICKGMSSHILINAFVCGLEGSFNAGVEKGRASANGVDQALTWLIGVHDAVAEVACVKPLMLFHSKAFFERIRTVAAESLSNQALTCPQAMVSYSPENHREREFLRVNSVLTALDVETSRFWYLQAAAQPVSVNPAVLREFLGGKFLEPNPIEATQ